MKYLVSAWIVIWLLAGCAALGHWSPLRSLEQSIIYQPSPYPDGNWQPDDLQFEEAHFASADGTPLHGWFVDHPHWNMTQRLNSLAKIPNYRGPVLIAHGDRDHTIPFEHGQRLYAAAVGPKQFVTIAGGDHNSPMPESYRIALDEFLAELPTAKD